MSAPRLAVFFMHDPILLIPIFIAIFFIVVGLLKYLWNSTIPQINGWSRISFWQAFRLILICAILFGGSRINGNG